MCLFRVLSIACLAFVVFLISDEQGFGQVTLDPAWPLNPRTFGGDGLDAASAVRQTTDGGYIVAGGTESYDGEQWESDVLVMKLDSAGDLDPAWDSNPKPFGGEWSDWARSVEQTSDGGYVIAGWAGSFGGRATDIYLIKLDAEGNLDSAWDVNPKTFGGSDSDSASSVQQTSDGGYIVAGSTLSFGAGKTDAYLIKLDARGNLDPTWDANPKTFGGSESDSALSVQQTSDGGYIVAGYTDSWSHVYLIKLDAAGNLDPAWDVNPKTFGNEGDDWARSVQQTSDGGYIVSGGAGAFDAQLCDAYLLRLDSGGNLQPTWDPNPKVFGGPRCDAARCVQQTSDGGYVVAGFTESVDSGEDVLLVKFAPARHFLRGDCNADGEAQGIPDAVFLLRHNFLGGDTPPCLAACDANGDGELGGTTDAVYVLAYFFLGSDEPPPSPFPACGAGQLWTDGPLGCQVEPQCP